MGLFFIALMAAAQTPQANGTAVTAPHGSRERLICRRETKLGSLVKAQRVCLTAEEWKLGKRLNRNTLDEWSSAIDGKGGAN